jgi:hypothetical protein
LRGLSSSRTTESIANCRHPLSAVRLVMAAPASHPKWFRGLLLGAVIALSVSLLDAGLGWHGTTMRPGPVGGPAVMHPVSFPGWPLPQALFGRRAWFIPYGFPIGSLGTLYLGPTASTPALAVGISSGRQFSALPWRPNFAWPILPAPGLLIDAVVYGGAWITWQWMRAQSRRKRGLCEACGYGPWVQGDACPECGATVRRSACRMCAACATFR